MHPSIGPILVPVDFSPRSEAALVFAANMASKFGSPLIALHVVHESGSQPGFYRRRETASATTPIREVAREMMDEFIDEIRTKHPEKQALVDIDMRLVDGIPPSRIPEMVNLLDAGMLVMGSHGRSGVDRVFNGSVSEAVMRQCDMPVTIVKRGIVNGPPSVPA